MVKVNIPDNTIGKRIQAVRLLISAKKRKHLSQKEFAELCNLPRNCQAMLSTWECDRCIPTIKNILIISKGTGVRPEWITFGTGPIYEDDLIKRIINECS